MARLITTGFEMGVTGATTYHEPGLDSDLGTVGRSSSTTTVRSGTRALQFQASASPARSPTVGRTASYTLATSFFLRTFINIRSLTFAGGHWKLFELWDAALSAVIASVRLQPDGTLQLWNETGVAQVGSSSAVLDQNRFIKAEFGFKIQSGASDDTLTLRLDGGEVASSSTLSVGTAAPGLLRIGDTNGSTNITGGGLVTCVFDDLALNDSTGGSQNSWPEGYGRTVLLRPISDNARDTLWTGGVGGTTNLFDAVDNIPPTGTATETDTTQIEHAGGAAGTTDRYDANMTTPASAGIGPNDAIDVVHFFDVDGEDIATGSKLLNFEVLSNPVIASPGNVTAGDNVGALGTWPTGWVTHAGGVAYNPTLALNTSPVMRARRPETASRVASVCFMGIYVDYTPGAMLPKQFNPIPFIPRGRNL